MDEFDAIHRLFMPLARGVSAAYDLKDDAAFLKHGAGSGWVITTDTIIEGVHFRHQDPIETVAAKLVACNLSDLIAKAAIPKFALLNVSWRQDRGQEALAGFARALGQALDSLCGQTPLIGGDTTSHDGPIVASLTLFGEAVGDRPVLRRGAAPGDIICVTGEIGSSFLGLAQLNGALKPVLDPELSDIYQVPRPPPLAFAPLVHQFAKASMDVSDGLLADCGHLARVSGVEIMLELDSLPHHPAALHWRDQHSDPIAAAIGLASGGDDYQTLMAVRPGDFQAAQAAALATHTDLTKIGVCRAGSGVIARFGGQRVAISGTGGWNHSIG